MKTDTSSISQAQSYRAIGEFWDTHDVTDFWDATEPVEFEVDLMHFPTPDPTLNAVLAEFVTSLRSLLADNLLAVYLQGSFGVGDWDIHSDVDFLVAVEEDIPDAQVAALEALHRRVYALDSAWAKHLEGSYFPRALLKRLQAGSGPLLYLDNGSRDLIRSQHDNSQVVRWVTREHGIALAGPPATELIDPVSADDLRAEVAAVMRDWGEEIFAGRYSPDNRWAQPFAVLSYCRMLHTLESGRVLSKPAGAVWAQKTLDSRWHDLIRRAWADRPNPSEKVYLPANPEEVTATLDFIRYALSVSDVVAGGRWQVVGGRWQGAGSRW